MSEKLMGCGEGIMDKIFAITSSFSVAKIGINRDFSK
jgi:hypothetical protein